VRRRAFHTFLGLICLLTVSAKCLATPISFPVTLDPKVQGGWLVATYIHACGGCIPDQSDESTYLAGSTFAASGVLNLANLASGPGAGAFADLTHGALGVDSVGFPDGSGEVVHAYMYVNVLITGQGTNTLDFRVNGSSGIDACLNLACQNTFGATLSVYSVANGVQLNNNAGGCEGQANCTGIAFPMDLSLTFNSTSNQPQLFQFGFSLLGASNGFAGIFATNTGLISVHLAPGVTMDAGSAFLTEAGDPNLGGGGPGTGPSPVPEPASLLLLGTGMFGVAARRWRNRRERD
jgi:hypothetical protein